MINHELQVYDRPATSSGDTTWIRSKRLFRATKDSVVHTTNPGSSTIKNNSSENICLSHVGVKDVAATSVDTAIENRIDSDFFVPGYLSFGNSGWTHRSSSVPCFSVRCSYNSRYALILEVPITLVVLPSWSSIVLICSIYVIRP